MNNDRLFPLFSVRKCFSVPLAALVLGVSMLFLALIFVLSSPQGWSLDRHYTIGSRSSVTAFLSSSLEESNTTVARAYVLRDIFSSQSESSQLAELVGLVAVLPLRPWHWT